MPPLVPSSVEVVVPVPSVRILEAEIVMPAPRVLDWIVPPLIARALLTTTVPAWNSAVPDKLSVPAVNDASPLTFTPPAD